jgi:hypothetical protein
MSKTNIPKPLKWQVFERDRYTCRYCGATGVPLEADHVYPDSRGGVTELDNLAAACEKCNRSKGDRLGVYPLPIDYVTRLAYANQIIEWYEARQEQAINQIATERADKIFEERINRLDQWNRRRKRAWRLISALRPLSLILVILGAILTLLGMATPYPVLMAGVLLPPVALVMIWLSNPLLGWYRRAYSSIPDFS